VTEITHRTDRFAWTLHLRRSVAYITLEGELDVAAVKFAEAALREALLQDANTIVLDLSELGFLDSSGLNLLIRTKADAESRSRRLYVSRHSKASKRVVEICDLDRWFTPTDAFGATLIPCPICDDLISPSSRQCEHCRSVL
jgi:anti-anti-sigma factor